MAEVSDYHVGQLVRTREMNEGGTVHSLDKEENLVWVRFRVRLGISVEAFDPDDLVPEPPAA